MDIAALSIMLNQNKVQQQADLSIMKIAMGVAENQSDLITSLASETTMNMELSIQPYLGTSLDLRA